jgi:hypothetical protein
MYPSDMSESLP